MTTSHDQAELRHGLRNVLAALRSGCALIESRLGPGADPELREVLEQMRAELAAGAALLGRMPGGESAAGGQVPR